MVDLTGYEKRGDLDAPFELTRARKPTKSQLEVRVRELEAEVERLQKS